MVWKIWKTTVDFLNSVFRNNVTISNNSITITSQTQTVGSKLWTSQSDFQNTPYQVNVDTTTTPGSVLLSLNVTTLDDFEYSNSITAHGWTFAGSGSDSNMVTSTDQAKSGVKSCKVNADNAQAWYSYSKSGDFDVTFWLYDELNTTANYAGVVLLEIFGGTQYDIGFVNNISTTQYAAYDGLWHTGVTRTLGWHKMEFSRSGSTLSWKVDGTTLTTSSVSAATTKIYMYTLGTSILVYYDLLQDAA